ncbi:hypothetical protein [Pedobacter metabolipauper]|uniref:Uncharacterized protein n=1 Tax=Pedobacter metabolipauper TaxID=425513 RepID=A0A4R6SYQ4_9SPHI|nr:hypothetical protein [Pedobacter metabolipauper]TDQ11576.1 hypothetical protein ATK78_0699 [Pedobacter metabolipauper]
MLNNFTYIQKNKMLLPVFVIGLLLCWFLAVNKTVDAISLNHKLNNEQQEENDLSFNPAYIQRKSAALDQILKSYQVGDQWNDQLWMQSSAIAAKQNVAVDFTLNKPPAEVDTTSVGSNQSLFFYGNYVQLAKLIDTLERTPGIGKIAALQVKLKKSDLSAGEVGKCVLRLDFKGLKK